MASRYPATKVLDYCLHPVRVIVDNESYFVPCGKCDGCLLHKANEWSMRLGVEIEDNKLAIFYTLTYSNFYLPTCVCTDERRSLDFFWSSHHDRNVRFNGKEIVPRNEDFSGFWLPYSFDGILATNYQSDQDYFPYSSKRDFQLYLKLVRKDLYEKFKEGFFNEVKDEGQLRFRFYAISEYGETLLRPHVHAVILPCHSEVADYLCYQGLFKSWQMCDETMFKQHCHFADSGCRGYITQYLTMSSRLPPVYHERSIRPWRLSSKGHAIGYNGFDEKKIFEDIITGVDEYSKDISRLDERYLLRYPKGIGNRLFPKCFEYRKKDFHGLYNVYSILWLSRRSGEWRRHPEVDFDRFRETVNPADFQAAQACEKYCLALGWHPFTYVYALDMYWYKQAMSSLRIWYQWQELQSDPYEIIRSYNNILYYIKKLLANTLSDVEYDTLDFFASGFGLGVLDCIWLRDEDILAYGNSEYACEVSDILADMVKMPKFNEKFGFSPNSVH